MFTRRPPLGVDPVPQEPPVRGMAGRLVTRTLPHGGGREVTAYLPMDPPVAVVFAADGQRVARWGALLEAHALPPTAIVGVHGLDDEDARLREYSPVFDAGRFAAHEHLFMETASEWASGELGLALAPEQTAVFGASAGGELALAMGIRHPDRYGSILCGSPGAGFQPDGVLEQPAPRTYLVAGSQEPFFLCQARRWASALDEAGGDVVLSVRAADHGTGLWRREFPLMVQWAFAEPAPGVRGLTPP